MTGYPNVCPTCQAGYDDAPRCNCERERVMRPGELSRWTLDRLERERKAEAPSRIEQVTRMRALRLPTKRFIEIETASGRVHCEPVGHQIATVTLPLMVDREQAREIERWMERGAALRVVIEPAAPKEHAIGVKFHQLWAEQSR